MKHLEIICLLIFVGLSSCSKRTHYFYNEASKYRYEIKKGSPKADAVVNGMLFDLHSNTPLRLNGAIKVDDKILSKTDTAGHFLFSIKPGRYSFTGVGFPYKFCDTHLIRLRAGDTLKLVFYLDDAPGTVD